MTNSSRTSGSDATTSVDARRLAEALGMTEPAGAVPVEPLRPDPTQGGRLRLDKCGALQGQPKLSAVRAHERPAGAPEFRPGARQPVDVAPPRAPSGPRPKKATLPPKIGSLRPPEAAFAGAPAAPSAPAPTAAPATPIAPSNEVWIPEGTFQFGEEREMRKLSGFWIDRFPVTHGDYEAFVRATGHRAPLYWPGGQMPADLRDHPVVGVDYFDALAFAQWKDKDLPYEDEWERAARGTDGRTYPWGNDPEMQAANTARSGLKMTLPVGYHPENVSPEGARDLVGNAWELTHSPAPGGGIVVRGGSWYDFALYAKSYFRFAARVDARNGTIGFRCVRRQDPRSGAPREVDPARAEAEIRARRAPEAPADLSRFTPERRDLVPDYRRLRNLVAERPPEPKAAAVAPEPKMSLPSAADVAAALSGLSSPARTPEAAVAPSLRSPPPPVVVAPPRVAPPQVALPQVAVPQAALPQVAVPQVAVPQVAVPHVEPPPSEPRPAMPPAPPRVVAATPPPPPVVPPPPTVPAPAPSLAQAPVALTAPTETRAPAAPTSQVPAAYVPPAYVSPAHVSPAHVAPAAGPVPRVAPPSAPAVPGVDRTGLRKAAESAAAGRASSAPSGGGTSEPTSTPFLWWALLGTGVVVCLALLGTLIVNLLAGGGSSDVEEIADTPEIERGTEPLPPDPVEPPEGPSGPTVPPPDSAQPTQPTPSGPPPGAPTSPPAEPATPPVEPTPPATTPSPTTPPADAPPDPTVPGLPEAREDPGDSLPPRVTDGGAPGWDGLVRRGSWVVVFAKTPDPKGFSTVRAANGLHRRLRDTGVDVLLVLPRADFQDATGALLPAEAIQQRLAEYGATSDLRILFDGAIGPSGATAARTMWRVKRDVSALWLKQGREEARTSPAEGSFSVASLADIAGRALQASPSAVPR